MFIQNAIVDEYNDKVYRSFDSVSKYTIKAHDSVIGACSTELKEKIMRQIPYVPLKNSKQLAHKLNLPVGQRTEIMIKIRTDDRLTNGASNAVKHTLDEKSKLPQICLVKICCKYEIRKALQPVQRWRWRNSHKNEQIRP